MEGKTLNHFIKGVFALCTHATKASNELPVGADFKYQYSVDSGFKRTSQDQTTRVRALLQSVCLKLGLTTTRVEDATSKDDIWDMVRECSDDLLSKIDLRLDEMKGYDRERNLAENSALATAGERGIAAEGRNFGGTKKNNRSGRPQDSFKTPADNSAAPWRPRLKGKPNAVAELKLERNADGEYNHPYKAEIEGLTYSEANLAPCKEQIYGDLGETPCTWVDTPEQLEQLAAILDAQPEFAVDLEHHAYRTFMGITCLMQISTRDQDFLVDPIELRDELHVLNSSFTNPSIQKVLHGSSHDVLWLQRDLGLYLVNLFDTGEAARALDYPKKSLAYLLKHFCDVAADKSYQRADWRIRPLTKQMLFYAQQDTHYLLYMADRMRNELIDRSVATGVDLLHRTLKASAALCLQRYKKPRLAPDAHLFLCSKKRLGLDEDQTRALGAVMRWRDMVAREEDESLAYVVPHKVFVSIARAVPKTQQQLFKACVPVPRLVRERADGLLQAIRDRASVPFTLSEAAAAEAAAGRAGGGEAEDTEMEDAGPATQLRSSTALSVDFSNPSTGRLDLIPLSGWAQPAEPVLIAARGGPGTMLPSLEQPRGHSTASAVMAAIRMNLAVDTTHMVSVEDKNPRKPKRQKREKQKQDPNKAGRQKFMSIREKYGNKRKSQTASPGSQPANKRSKHDGDVPKPAAGPAKPKPVDPNFKPFQYKGGFGKPQLENPDAFDPYKHGKRGYKPTTGRVNQRGPKKGGKKKGSKRF